MSRFDRLVAAVRGVYLAAYWVPDREVKNGQDLWSELRDAAGISPSTATKTLGERQVSPLMTSLAGAVSEQALAAKALHDDLTAKLAIMEAERDMLKADYADLHQHNGELAARVQELSAGLERYESRAEALKTEEAAKQQQDASADAPSESASQESADGPPRPTSPADHTPIA